MRRWSPVSAVAANQSQERGTDMGVLSGKVAVVTGASRGIGRAIAERLGGLGASVVVNYSSSEQAAHECAATIEKTGARAVAIKANVAEVDEIRELFESAIEAFGDVDIAVANAGLEIVDVAAVDFTEEQFDRAFSVNTKGTFFTLQQAARTVADSGRIICVGSSSTEFPTLGHALYGGSKVAPRFLVEVLAKELGSRGITVNSIQPTAISGAGVSANGLRPAAQQFVDQFNPMKRAGTLQDVADAVEYLAGPLAGFVSGQHLLLTGGGPA
jgi:3-oxoacyl-[acyl-carrier protein] reductase